MPRGRPSAFSGARTTLLGQLAKFVIQVLGLVVLARLLTPEDYGLYGMVLVFTGLGFLIGDFGLSSASIQAREINQQQRSNLFWANLALGAVTTAAFLALANPVAALYDEPQLVEIIMVLASIFTVLAASTQFAANATRELRFGVLAISDVSSQLIGLLLAIVLAARGFGVWALVLQQLAIAMTLLVVLACTSRWRPGIPRRAPMKALFSYGANTFGVQVLNFVSAKIDSFLIGKFLGASPLGFYDRAYQLNQIPTQQLATPLTRVALPLLSRHQDSIPEMQERLIVLMRIMAFGLGGVVLFCGANASSLVLLVLGPQWVQVAPLLAILSVGGFFQAVGYIYYWAFLALGKTGLQLKFTLWTRPLMSAIIVGGIVFGVHGVAAGVTVGLVVNWLVLSILALPRAGVQSAVLVGVVARAFAIWFPASWIIAYAQQTWLSEMPPVVVLVLNALLTMGTVCIALVLPVYRVDLRSVLQFVKKGRQ